MFKGNEGLRQRMFKISEGLRACEGLSASDGLRAASV